MRLKVVWHDLPCRPRGGGRPCGRWGQGWPWRRVSTTASHTPNYQQNTRHTVACSHPHFLHPPERIAWHKNEDFKYFDLLFHWKCEPWLSPWFTWAPASSSSRTHSACPRTQASCSGVIESTATTLTDAPPWIRCCSSVVWPCDAALCTSVLSDQQPAGEWTQCVCFWVNPHLQYNVSS